MKFVRIPGVLILGGLLLSSGVGLSQRLPSMEDAPWLGFFSGYEQKNFDIGVDDEGRIWVYMKKSKNQRIGPTRWIKTYIEVVVESPDGERSIKSLRDDEAFETEQEKGLDHDEVKFSAMTKGGAKVEATVKYTRKGVILGGRILDGGKLAKKGKLFLRYRVSVPTMYGSRYRGKDKESQKRMEDDVITFVRAKDEKRVELVSYKDVDLAAEENAKDGVLQIKVDMDGMEGKELQFSTLDKKGVFYFENAKPGVKGKLWQGYKVIWEQEIGTEKTKDAIKPLVIEVL